MNVKIVNGDEHIYKLPVYLCILFSSFIASAEQVPSQDISFLSGKKGFLDLIIQEVSTLCFCPDWQWQQCRVAGDKICVAFTTAKAVTKKNLRRNKRVGNPFFVSSCSICIHSRQLLFPNKLHYFRPGFSRFNLALFLDRVLSNMDYFCCFLLKQSFY